MSKTGLFLTSFVAAVPGGCLAYLMVMTFLNFSGGPNMWTKALAGMLLFIGGLLGIMPFGILVFAGPRAEKLPKKPKEEPSSKSKAGEVEAESGEVEVEDEEAEAAVVASDDNLETLEEEGDEFVATEEMASGEEAEVEDFGAGEDFEADAEEVDSDELLADEEEEPKKGKKK